MEALAISSDLTQINPPAAGFNLSNGPYNKLTASSPKQPSDNNEQFGLSKKMYQNLENVKYSNKLLLSVLNDIIDLGQSDMGTLSFNFSIFNFHELLNDVFKYF